MERDAVQEAVTLLRSRRSESGERLVLLAQEQEQLETEIARIDAAIQALAVPGAGAVDRQVFASDTATVVAKETGRVRPVKALVRELVESTPKEWTAGEIVAELQGRSEPMTVADPASAVRTALWHLRNEGVVTQIGEGRGSRNIATQWLPESTEGPDFSGPSEDNHLSAVGAADPDSGGR